jgi:hypothetical protein
MGREGILRSFRVTKPSRLPLPRYAREHLENSDAELSIGYCLSEWTHSSCQLGTQHTDCYCVCYRSSKRVLFNCNSEQGESELSFASSIFDEWTISDETSSRIAVLILDSSSQWTPKVSSISSTMHHLRPTRPSSSPIHKLHWICSTVSQGLCPQITSPHYSITTSSRILFSTARTL